MQWPLNSTRKLFCFSFLLLFFKFQVRTEYCMLKICFYRTKCIFFWLAGSFSRSAHDNKRKFLRSSFANKSAYLTEWNRDREKKSRSRFCAYTWISSEKKVEASNWMAFIRHTVLHYKIVPVILWMRLGAYH